MNQNEIISQLAQEEMDLMKAWDSQPDGGHIWSDWIDEDVTRCENCMANILWVSQYPSCDGYLAYSKEKNRKLREAAGL